MKGIYKNAGKGFLCGFFWALSVILCAGMLFVGTFYYFTGSPLGFLKFFHTFYIVETQYAGTVDKTALLDGALEGIVAKLDDRHSSYLDGETYESFANQTAGTYGGVGVYLGVHDNEPFVVGVVAGEPADQAGIRRGDVITAIDGENADTMTIEDISQKIRGPVGTSVSVTLLRDDSTYTVELKRKSIHLKTVGGTMLSGTDTAYIQVAIFSENTGKEFTSLYQSLREQGMNKMILDLRNNPGGLIDQAVAVANNFVPPDSTILSYTDKTGKETDYVADGTEDRVEMVVLINENSASAAEILAGAVQDLQLGTVVGTKSYGKGTVQGIYSLGSADAVKLTVAKYKTARGRMIDGAGIEPDVAVPLQAGDTVDRQFEKAYELLNP